MSVQIEIKNLAKLERAFKRSPATVVEEVGNFLVRAMAAVRSVIWNEPWKLGATGGGVPVLTGNLRQAHRTVFESMRAYIYPDTAIAPYAKWVHDGTSRMPARPWLPYAEKAAEPEVNRLAKEMMGRIADNLAN